MVSKVITIKNPTGLHLRPAGMFCKKASEFEECSIKFSVGKTTGNAKSVLSVLAAGIKMGDEIELICEGKNEEEVLEEMLRFVEKEIED